MITDKYASSVSGDYKVLRGLSTDTKPTDVANGSEMVEIDTGDLYRYDAENGVWEKDESGGGLPDVTSADNGKVLKVADGEWGAEEGLLVFDIQENLDTNKYNFSNLYDNARFREAITNNWQNIVLRTQSGEYTRWYYFPIGSYLSTYSAQGIDADFVVFVGISSVNSAGGISGNTLKTKNIHDTVIDFEMSGINMVGANDLPASLRSPLQVIMSPFWYDASSSALFLQLIDGAKLILTGTDVGTVTFDVASAFQPQMELIIANMAQEYINKARNAVVAFSTDQTNWKFGYIIGGKEVYDIETGAETFSDISIQIPDDGAISTMRISKTVVDVTVIHPAKTSGGTIPS